MSGVTALIGDRYTRSEVEIEIHASSYSNDWDIYLGSPDLGVKHGLGRTQTEAVNELFWHLFD